MANIVFDPSNPPTLQAGDTLQFAYRPESWRVKALLPYSGITFEGILGPNGERPIIDGDGAIQLPGPDPFDTSLINRALLLICPPAGAPYDESVSGITIRNLEFRNANKFVGGWMPFGSRIAQPWVNASALSLYRCAKPLVENCLLTYCDQGLFFKSYDERTRLVLQPRFSRVTMEFNGTGPGQHNCYGEGMGPIFEFCTFGFLLPQSDGFGSHDRNCGAIYRNCFFKSRLEAVGAEDSGFLRDQELTDAPRTWNHVYGCVVCKPSDLWKTTGVHFGTDQGTLPRGRLFWYHNTHINWNKWPAPDGDGRLGTQFFKLNGNWLGAVNNIFASLSPDPNVGRGVIELASEEDPEDYGHGQIQFWTNAGPDDLSTGGPPFLDQAPPPDYVYWPISDPGFVDPLTWNFALRPDSACRNATCGLGLDLWKPVLWQPTFGDGGVIGWRPRRTWNNPGAWEDGQ